ncbi:MAG: T9SS type A sorting domain-containing protein [Bacteroidales bacterium]|nr:T9SS type A sorting domain-containing protein [Bacteroidales bacterium]MBO7481318.1 T9SS type A sorting domain-containing protein [Bacteroidales bacterium]
MKKIFLFLSAALLSLGVSATQYDVLINSFNVDVTADNNIDFTSQLNGAKLIEGDEIRLTLQGYFDAPAIVTYNTIADNAYDADGAGGYWNMLAAWEGVELGTAEIGTIFNVTKTITITTTALQKDKYIVQLGFSFASLKDKKKYQQFKFRPTEAALSVEAQTYKVDLPTLKFGSDGGEQNPNYKAEVTFETEAAMAADDILQVVINGKFSEGVQGIIFMVFDNDGNEVLGWSVKGTFQAPKDETVNETLDLVMPAACPTTAAKLGVFIEGYDAEKPISFLKDGDVAHDPVEVAKKDYTEVTLGYNQYATPANYQFIEAEVASDVQVGDYVTFSINGVSNAAFSKMKVYLRNPEGYSAISEYVEILANTEANGAVSYSGKVEASSAAAKCDLVFEIPDEATEGTSIVIAPAGNVAVAEVAPAFAVEGGMVYSAGEIVVYNVAGKEIAKASKSFNVNTLAAGVYFITAKEGTIKFVK